MRERQKATGTQRRKGEAFHQKEKRKARLMRGNSTLENLYTHTEREREGESISVVS